MFADPNFGMWRQDLEICEHIAAIQERQGYPRSLFASTGKNKKERISEALRKLKGTMKLWMSVQSLDLEVLENIERKNIKLELSNQEIKSDELTNFNVNFRISGDLRDCLEQESCEEAYNLGDTYIRITCKIDLFKKVVKK